MKAQIQILKNLVLLILLMAVQGWAAEESADRYDPIKVDPIMGDYEGVYQSTGQKDRPADAKVVGEGQDEYRVWITVGGETQFQIELKGKKVDNKVPLAGMSGGVNWAGEIAGGKLNLTIPGNYGASLNLEHLIKESPTAGLEPPENAIVLLPYEEGVAPDLSEWTNDSWLALPEGSMEVGSEPNITKNVFKDIQLHMEFSIPYEPEKREQARGNSGVYIQNRYEVQILDSFGLILRGGDCGSVYTVAVTPINAALPPLSWQTYDITFRAPRLNEKGEVVEKPWVTVLWNGVKIHDTLLIPGPTLGGAEGMPAEGPILLQDHGSKLRYRNIWLIELKADSPVIK
jgi:hypothetical protein